jgi:hypothetical protein
MEECRAEYRYDGKSIYFREMTEEEWNLNHGTLG